MKIFKNLFNRNLIAPGFACLLFFPVNNTLSQVFPGIDWVQVRPESQGIDSAKLEEAVHYLECRLGAAGSYTGGLLIIRNGYVVWSNPDSYTLYETMSVSKSFLSTGLGLMVEDGKVAITDPVRKYDPRIGEKYPDAIVRHFVTMTSGYDGQHSTIHDPGYDCDLTGRCDAWDPGIPMDPIFPPGTRFRYWDEAELELGYALGLAGEDRYYVRDLLQKRIADPIGMKHFTWRDVQTAVGTIPAMNGGLKTSARDLSRFGLLFLNRGNWNGRQLISSSWVDEATSVQVPVSIPNDITERAYGSGVYGYNWWINGITPGGERYLPLADSTTYWASGYGTNRCFVIPAWNMVVVRTGQKPTNWSGADGAFNIFLFLIGQSINDR